MVFLVRSSSLDRHEELSHCCSHWISYVFIFPVSSIVAVLRGVNLNDDALQGLVIKKLPLPCGIMLTRDVPFSDSKFDPWIVLSKLVSLASCRSPLHQSRGPGLALPQAWPFIF